MKTIINMYLKSQVLYYNFYCVIIDIDAILYTNFQFPIDTFSNIMNYSNYDMLKKSRMLSKDITQKVNYNYYNKTIFNAESLNMGYIEKNGKFIKKFRNYNKQFELKYCQNHLHI